MKKLYNQFKRLMLYGGLTPEDYRLVRRTVDRDNLEHLQFYTLFATVFFAAIAWLYMTYYHETEAGKMTVVVGYVAIGCVMGVLALISRDKNIIAMSERYLAGLRMVFYLAVYLLTIFLALAHKYDAAVALVVAMVVLPMLFTEVPVFHVTLTLTVDIVFMIISFQIKDIWGGYLDLWNGIIFGTISVVLSTGNARIRFRMFDQERRVRLLSETDVLTGTMNRNKYEKSLAVHANNPAPRISYVYGDVNGLHELNNSQGHLAGDTMLKTVATALVDAFGQENVYRMGGDEFLAFVPWQTVREVIYTVRGIEARLADAGYHVSFGIAQARRDGDKPYDVAALMQTAEQRMYAIKRAYYSQKNHDRRHEWSPVDHEINE